MNCRYGFVGEASPFSPQTRDHSRGDDRPPNSSRSCALHGFLSSRLRRKSRSSRSVLVAWDGLQVSVPIFSACFASSIGPAGPAGRGFLRLIVGFLMLGFKVGGSVRRFGSSMTPDVEAAHRKCSLDMIKFEDEIEKIQHEYEAAKRSFLNIPVALKEMPKMNPEGIYVNRNVRLDDIQVYGFDYDYTLAHYSEHLQSLIYDLAKKHLVNEVSCRWNFVSAVVR
ncbi:hypothetical protein B296_00021763 [Ensete ventricosum]|uniref:5'-nucleotidase n=1 Tax=Ensete ventricosum TaxID=4639 RepID=A0A426ZNN8_ENSVE|nr:hypothetical protein B296_00021763 [Ensete ventricosum]